MECYYHPERESTDNCAICGKSICKECGLEIAGKTYCKECLEKIVGLGIENKSPSNEVRQETPIQEPIHQERGPISETIYGKENDEISYSQPEAHASEVKHFEDDSPYNINYQGSSDSDFPYESTIRQQEPQITQNEYDLYPETPQTPSRNTQDFIYPDHRFDEPRTDLENKYERYLDDLYYDENELPLDQQLANDEAQYGSLTRRPYAPRTEEALLREQYEQEEKRIKRPETPEEMEARIRAEILAEKEGKSGIRDSNIHNLNYKEEKEPMNIVDILLTIVLVIVILIVVYYIIYIFALQNAYPTFMDALFGLTSPQTVIGNLFTPQV